MLEGGRSVPSSFYDIAPPEVAVGLQHIWDAFYDLCTERPGGMGVGYIPSSKIRKYADKELDLDPDSEEADTFFVLVRKMDDEYVSTANSPNKKTTGVEVAPTDAAGMTLLFDKLGADHNKKNNATLKSKGKERKK